MKKLATLLLLCLSANLYAENIRPWVLSQKPALKNTEAVQKSRLVDDTTQVIIDFKNLQKINLDQTLDLDLPNQETLKVSVSKKIHNKNGSITLHARDLAKQHYLVFTFDDNLAYGYIENGQQAYVLEVSNDKNNISVLKQPDIHDDVKPIIGLSEAPASPFRMNQAKQQLRRGKTTEELADLDIIVFYTTSAKDYVPGSIETRINQYIATTNHYLEASGVFINVNLVHSAEVGFVEDPLDPNSLGALSSANDPEFNEVKDLRYEYGADIVAILTTEGGGSAFASCGRDGSISGCAQTRYFRSSIHDSVSGTTFSHELGHSIGLAHSRSQGEVGYSFPYAIGYRRQNEQGEWVGTIMAYAAGIRRYSTPGVLSDGSARTGVGREYQNGSDASFALNAIRFQAADYFHQNPDLTLAADLVEQAGNTQLAECVREGAGKYPATIHRLTCSGKQLSSIAGLEFLTQLDYLDLSNNNIADLSDFPVLQNLQQVNINDNRVEEIAPLMQLPRLAILRVSNNNITNLPDFKVLEAYRATKDSVAIDLSNNKISGIESLLEILERNSLLVSTNLNGNEEIPCWQKRHLIKNHFSFDTRINEGLVPNLDNYLPCDSSEDYLDYNNNQISNLDDIENDGNPFLIEPEQQIELTGRVYTVNENDGKARLEVKRVGDTLNGDITFYAATYEALVSFEPESIGSETPDTPSSELAGIAAYQHFDFVPLNQPFTIAEGEDSVYIEVEVIDDDLYYGDIQFQVNLYGVTGATLSGSKTATVNIIDDEVNTMAIKDEAEGLTSPEPPVTTPTPVVTPNNTGQDNTSGGGGSLGYYWLLVWLLCAMWLKARYTR